LAKINTTTLVSTAADLFRLNGYHNTSMADIARGCGLSKASVYHHINSKQEAAMLAVEQVCYHFDQKVFVHLEDAALSASERAHAFIDASLGYCMSLKGGGCLLTTLSAEISRTTNAPLCEAVQHFFSAWQAALSGLFQEKLGERAAQEAEECLALWQGLILLGRLGGGNSRLGLLKAKVNGLIG
jgi:TetR/AcrR family transcriptional repressor of nem operon